MAELRSDREWEHWPQERRLDDGIRRKLRALFQPTLPGERDVEEALAEHTYELELRARQLAETVADLEAREERTRELRSAVEQMLRRGSAELDERHGELTELAARLAEREARVAEAEAALAERRRELGAVELRRAALERREESTGEREQRLAEREQQLEERERALAGLEEQARALAARESELAARASELEALEARMLETLGAIEREQALLAARNAVADERERQALELDRRAAQVEEREAALREREQALTAAEETVESGREELRVAVAAVSRDLGLAADAGRAEPSGPAYLALVPGDRYRLVERYDGPVQAGATIEVDGAPYRVVRLGAAPLPGERRRCAFLEPLPSGAPASPDAASPAPT